MTKYLILRPYVYDMEAGLGPYVIIQEVTEDLLKKWLERSDIICGLKVTQKSVAFLEFWDSVKLYEIPYDCPDWTKEQQNQWAEMEGTLDNEEYLWVETLPPLKDEWQVSTEADLQRFCAYGDVTWETYIRHTEVRVVTCDLDVQGLHKEFLGIDSES